SAGRTGKAHELHRGGRCFRDGSAGTLFHREDEDETHVRRHPLRQEPEDSSVSKMSADEPLKCALEIVIFTNHLALPCVPAHGRLGAFELRLPLCEPWPQLRNPLPELSARARDHERLRTYGDSEPVEILKHTFEFFVESRDRCFNLPELCRITAGCLNSVPPLDEGLDPFLEVIKALLEL